MKKQSTAVQEQYTKVLETAAAIRNETNTNKLFTLIPTQATQTVSLWLAIAQDTKDINPSLEADIKKNPSRFEQLFPKDDCWIRRMWDVTQTFDCRQCGCTH